MARRNRAANFAKSRDTLLPWRLEPNMIVEPDFLNTEE